MSPRICRAFALANPCSSVERGPVGRGRMPATYASVTPLNRNVDRAKSTFFADDLRQPGYGIRSENCQSVARRARETGPLGLGNSDVQEPERLRASLGNVDRAKSTFCPDLCQTRFLEGSGENVSR